MALSITINNASIYKKLSITKFNYGMLGGGNQIDKISLYHDLLGDSKLLLPIKLFEGD